MKKILILLILTSFLKVYGHTFDKVYTGQWAMTTWKYEFQKDGSYKKTSSGHYGNHTFQGYYKIYNDTIELVNGYENSNETLNKYYLISTYYDKFTKKHESRIIDLINLYEYYNNENNSISLKNKIVKVEITDSLNKVIKSKTCYVPIDFVTCKTQIDLKWCVDFINFPEKLKGAYFIKPEKFNYK